MKRAHTRGKSLIFPFRAPRKSRVSIKRDKIDPQTEKSEHKITADGVTVISKIPGNNALCAMSMAENSDFNAYLLAAYNAVLLADASQWAAMNGIWRHLTLPRTHICNGMSFQKLPGEPYQAAVQMVSWVLMVADYHRLPL